MKPMRILFLTSVLCACLVLFSDASQAVYKALVGRTGVGKSWILNSITNCGTKECSETMSCTKGIQECPGHYLDTIGLDDDGREYEINYAGKRVKMSGLTIPLFTLLEYFELKKISQVEFFEIKDVNNMREGASSQFFVNFLQQQLHCNVTRVLNKFRPNYPPHMNRAQSGDILIHEDAQLLPELVGSVCEFGLDPHWKSKVVESDMIGVRSSISLQHCKELLKRKNEFVALTNRPPVPLESKYCGYEAVVGYTDDKVWEVKFGVFKFGRNRERRPIKEVRINPECARFVEEANKMINEANKQLAEEKLEYARILISVEEELNKCRQLPNFEF